MDLCTNSGLLGGDAGVDIDLCNPSGWSNLLEWCFRVPLLGFFTCFSSASFESSLFNSEGSLPCCLLISANSRSSPVAAIVDVCLNTQMLRK